LSGTQRLSGAQVEEIAIEFVMKYERSQGRVPIDTRRVPQAAADINSSPRTIEVKASSGSARGQDIWLEPRQYEAATSDHDFHIYIVDNVAQGDPSRFQLHVLSGDRLARLLTRAKPQSYYLVPWPIGDYDTDQQPSV
jgi:hypothetical protein